MNEEKAQKIIAKRNAQKKWEKYDTPEKRKEILKKAHAGLKKYHENRRLAKEMFGKQ